MKEALYAIALSRLSGVSMPAAIRLLQESGALGKLEKGLREAAKIRMAHPDATIEELASYMNPPLTKSGMNHRLQKLQVQANNLRGQTKDRE